MYSLVESLNSFMALCWEEVACGEGEGQRGHAISIGRSLSSMAMSAQTLHTK